MNKNKTIIFFVFISVIIQNIAMVIIDCDNYYYSFATGLNIQQGTIKNFIPILLLISPIIIETYLYCGEIYELSHGYGKLLIIRSYSKTKLIILSILNSATLLLLFILIQFFIYSISNRNMIQTTNYTILKSVLMYFIVNLNLILLEYIIGQFLQVHISALLTILYVSVSCCLGYATKISKLKILFFPSLMFGSLNGSIGNEKNYFIYMAIFTGIIFVLLT